MRCGAHQRKELEQLCRYITRPSIANERLTRTGAGDVVRKASDQRAAGEGPRRALRRIPGGIYLIFDEASSALDNWTSA